MKRRRIVRVTQEFFDRLDDLLPDDRSATGTPSTTDFLAHDLPSVIDALATDYERVTTTVPGIEGVRVLVTSGMLVQYMAVYTQTDDQGNVLIVFLDVELNLNG